MTSPRPFEPPQRWLTVTEAAEYARCGVKVIYRAVRGRKLRAAKVGGRRELRFLATWIDEFLIASSTPVVVSEPHSSRPLSV